MKLLEIYKECNLKVSTDSRNITPGSLFIALKGDNFNGNKYAEESLQKGAKYAIVDEKEYAVNDKIILVEDSLIALQSLANEYRNEFQIPVLGITGSNGKTTAKELIHTVLSKKFKTHSTPGNFNNHIGLPLTILSMPQDCEFLVLEMGDNHSGEIKQLCEIGEPNYGLVTNVGKDHIEGFGSFENNKLAKKELFDFLVQTNGSVFIPLFENDLLEMTLEVENRIEFGTLGSFSFVDQLPSNPFVQFKNGSTLTQTNLIGDYNIKNIEMAICIGKYFEVEPNQIHKSITEYFPKNNRSQYIEKNGHKVFLDAYNANPSSVELALESFNKQNLEDSRVVILGDMLELGEESIKEHQTIVDKLKELELEVFLVGSEYLKTEYPESFKVVKHRSELIEYLQENKLPPSQILIKGSRGIRLEEVLEML